MTFQLLTQRPQDSSLNSRTSIAMDHSCHVSQRDDLLERFETDNWSGWWEVAHHLLSTEARFDSVRLLWLWTSPLYPKALCRP